MQVAQHHALHDVRSPYANLRLGLRHLLLLCVQLQEHFRAGGSVRGHRGGGADGNNREWRQHIAPSRGRQVAQALVRKDRLGRGGAAVRVGQEAAGSQQRVCHAEPRGVQVIRVQRFCVLQGMYV